MNAALISDVQFRILTQQLKSLQEQCERNFDRSIASLKLGKDWYTIGHAMMHIARGYFFLAEVQKEFPSEASDWYEAYRRVRRFAMGTKEAFEHTGDTSLQAVGLFNLGCYLQFGEEIEEAKSIIQKIFDLDDTPEIEEIKRRAEMLRGLMDN